MVKKIYVNQDECIGCTLCTQMCPDVFEMDENGKAEVKDIEGAEQDQIDMAIEACPTKAIKKD